MQKPLKTNKQMKLIYQNDYGATFLLYDSPNPRCKIQLVVDAIGLFMSVDDLEHLLKIVHGSYESCHCTDCGGNACNKIWRVNPLIDICLKVDGHYLGLLEDLIKGTRFMLDMDATLDQYRLKPKNES